MLGTSTCLALDEMRRAGGSGAGGKPHDWTEEELVRVMYSCALDEFLAVVGQPEVERATGRVMKCLAAGKQVLGEVRGCDLM